MAMKTSRGYTLTEMIIVVAILGVMTAVMSTLLVNMTSFWRQTSAKDSVQQDVRASLDIINRFTREAEKGTIVIDNAAGQPPYSRLTFTTIGNQNISFYQSGKTLYMTNGTSQSILSKNIAYLAFSYPHTDDNSLISIAITTQAATYKGGKAALQLSIQKVRIMN